MSTSESALDELNCAFPDAIGLTQLPSFRRKLLKWFDQHRRDLPWRKNPTPYRVWVSEIMLQQTQVATVIDYYRRFMKSFPSVKALAEADLEVVLKHWEGLGYYRRARQLHRAAKLVVDQHGSQFPVSFDQVLALPGIGRYTAGAILSISQDQRLPILEGNTFRLYSRLILMTSDPKTGQNQKQLWRFAEKILPRKRCGDFNQALMELGATICRPTQPKCNECPLANFCPTVARGWQDRIPASSKKMSYEEIREAAVVIQRRGKYLVRQCQPGERWAGLWDFVRYGLESETKKEQELSRRIKLDYGLNVELAVAGRPLKHAVTRFRITLDIYLATEVRGSLKREKLPVKWISGKELAEIPMSTTGRRITEMIESLQKV